MREKLIELCEDLDTLPCCDTYEGQADYLIANGVTVTDNNVGCKWIPVTERLPEDDLPKTSKRKMIRCLVYTDKGTVKPCVRQRCISRKVDGEWVYTPWEWNKDIFAKPTHWMPLPTPPKGE